VTEPSPTGLIADTSPLLFFHRSGAMDLLSAVSSNRLAEGDRSSGSVWVPQAVHTEIAEGERSGYDMPDLGALPWVGTGPAPAAPPSEWLALDLGPGELALKKGICEIRSSDADKIELCRIRPIARVSVETLFHVSYCLFY